MAFDLDAARAWDYVRNKLAFWGHQRWSIEVQNGIASGSVTLRSGLVLIAQPARDGNARLPLDRSSKPVQQLDRALCAIAERYGASRREWVMMEMEYASAAGACPH
jgi:hypothetical protein